MNKYMLDKERLQKYLTQLRGCAGLSAEALADKVGLTKQAISYMENHPEKPMTKMQYMCIRAVFDEEYYKNPDNVNLRDCYDLVFSDEQFYEENKDRLEYALYQAVEDTKTQKKKIRADAKKEGKILASVAGATAATIAIGGVASATFPMVFPIVASAAIISSRKMMATKAQKKYKDSPSVERASGKILHSDWIAAAFDYKETTEQ